MESLVNSGPLAVAGIFGIGLIIGLIVLTTAEESLTTVARAAARDIGGSFWIGFCGKPWRSRCWSWPHWPA